MKNRIRQSGLFVVLGMSLWLVLGFAPSLTKTPGTSTLLFLSPMGGSSLTPTPFFRFPVVPNAEVSGYVDHSGQHDYQTNGYVVFYSGRQNMGSAYANGFWFTCPTIGNSWVGCEVTASSEAACPDNRELWYDTHYGTDFEYAANWRTGSTCNLNQFIGITRPVYAPAKGYVEIGTQNIANNGNHLYLYHDLNGDNNYMNDNFRSAYLHFANPITLTTGQIVSEGQYLGLGGMTGKAYTPHLHFEVQRLINGQWRPVDPFGWTGAGNDPWPYANYPLWHYYNYIPAVLKNYCPYGEKLVNGNFNTGDTTGWVASRSNCPYSIVQPYGGAEFGAMLGRCDNNYDQLYQTVCVPASVSNATLTYSWWVSSLEPLGPSVYDRLYVSVYDANGNFLRSLNILSNADQRDQWFVATSPLRDFAGQTIRISFEAVTDIDTPTSFWIENVSVFTSP